MFDGTRFRPLSFFTTELMPCSYLPDQSEQRVVIDLSKTGAAASHDELARAGFRRSHRWAYRPACPRCSACRSIRVRVDEFVWTRSFRRIRNRNRDLITHWRKPVATFEQYRMFTAYQAARHTNGEMQDFSYADYAAMICMTPIETRVAEFRHAETDELVGAGLIDFQDDGLSAAYSFFAETRPDRSLGTYIILALIESVQSFGLPYLYLGYWIADSPKMHYKARFGPAEVLTPAGWQRFSPDPGP